jgi:hypothetical protein
VSGCINPYFLGLSTSWMWFVKFTPRPLYPRGKSPRYPLNRWLDGPQSRSERRGEEKILDSTGTRTPTPRSSSYTDYAIPAPCIYIYIILKQMTHTVTTVLCISLSVRHSNRCIKYEQWILTRHESTCLMQYTKYFYAYLYLCIPFIYSVKEKPGKGPSSTARFLLVSFLAYSSTLRMEAIVSSETSVSFNRTTRPYSLEDCTLHSYSCDNLNSDMISSTLVTLDEKARRKYYVFKKVKVDKCLWHTLVKLRVSVAQEAYSP